MVIGFREIILLYSPIQKICCNNDQSPGLETSITIFNVMFCHLVILARFNSIFYISLFIYLIYLYFTDLFLAERGGQTVHVVSIAHVVSIVSTTNTKQRTVAYRTKPIEIIIINYFQLPKQIY